jgi:glycine reductase
MVGSNRIVQATKIVNPLGNANLGPQKEKAHRRDILIKALNALKADIKEQTLFN